MKISHETAAPALSIAVAAIWRRRNGRIEVLITRRPDRVHLGGFWELPGGKIGLGEEAAAAAAREVAEETGLQLEPASLNLINPVEHHYPDRLVRIVPFLAEIAGDPAIQPVGIVDFRWISLNELPEVPFPPANVSITRAIAQALSAISCAASTTPSQARIDASPCNILTHRE